MARQRGAAVCALGWVLGHVEARAPRSRAIDSRAHPRVRRERPRAPRVRRRGPPAHSRHEAADPDRAARGWPGELAADARVAGVEDPRAVVPRGARDRRDDRRPDAARARARGRRADLARRTAAQGSGPVPRHRRQRLRVLGAARPDRRSPMAGTGAPLRHARDRPGGGAARRARARALHADDRRRRSRRCTCARASTRSPGSRFSTSSRRAPLRRFVPRWRPAAPGCSRRDRWHGGEPRTRGRRPERGAPRAGRPRTRRSRGRRRRARASRPPPRDP